MPSIIFFDIDGTIVTEDDRMIIPDSTIKAIAAARSKGNLTFVNTGRPVFNVSNRIRSLGFDGYICGCGTYIEYQNEVLFYRTVEQSLCREIAAAMRKCKVTPVYERSDGYFFDDNAVHNPELDSFMNIFISTGISTDGRIEDADFGFDKFVFWTNPESDMETVRSVLSPYFQIIDRGHGFYEIPPLNYTKATGIDFILNKLRISLDSAYAIGDSTNDLPMLQAVPNSIAMGGAEKLYPYVSYITSPIEEDGIFNALDHFGLI